MRALRDALERMLRGLSRPLARHREGQGRPSDSATEMTETARGRSYPVLPKALARQLAAVPLTDGLYRPCRVTLDDGSVVDHVYLAEARPWFSRWGVWPEDDAVKRSLDIRRVVAIADSSTRLPPEFAKVLYAEGETGMGYTLFTVRFRDGSSAVVMTGNAVDFIDYPPGQSSDTVVEVLPHVGRDAPEYRDGPAYRWCLYEPASNGPLACPGE